MALIGTIRKHSWILVVTIALALGGFLIMDITNSAQRGGRATPVLGKVNGEEITLTEFNNTQQVLYSNSGADIYNQRSYLWNYFVEKSILKSESNALGLGVGDVELEDLQYGNNLSPIIRQQFQNSQTGQVDREQLNQIKQMIESGQAQPNLATYWKYQEDQIIKSQLQTKLNTLISKSIFTPSWMAELRHKDQNEKISFEYVQIPFDDVDDADVEVTDADIKAYIDDHKTTYTRDEETRQVSYVKYDVIPTAEDSATIYKDLDELVTPFAESTNDTLFLDQNYSQYDPVYYTEAELNPVVADSIVVLDNGQVYGPYISGNNYEIVKLIDKKIIPDSVKSRHILRTANPNSQAEMAAAYRYIDSLKTLIETGQASFDSLARKDSQDPGSGSLGGELGYAALNRMVKPFNDMIFYQAKPGDLNIVATQFGIHLIEVQDYKYLTNNMGYKIGTIVSPIVPSEGTQNEVYNQAADFVSSNRTLAEMQKAADENPALSLEKSGFLQENDAYMLEVGTGQTARDIIKWAFSDNADIDMVSPDVYIYQDPVNYFNSKYLIVALSAIQPSGVASIESVRDDVTPLVRNQKKGQQLAGKISGTDLNAIAGQFNTEVDSAQNITFVSTFVPGLGNEPKVIAEAFKLSRDQISSPIIGENGVYVIKVTDKIEDATDPNISVLRQQASAQLRAAVSSRLIESLRKNAKIKAYGSTYY